MISNFVYCQIGSQTMYHNRIMYIVLSKICKFLCIKILGRVKNLAQIGTTLKIEKLLQAVPKILPTPFMKVFLFFLEYCKQSYKVYTQISDTKCKGWSRTSFDDCKQKCINNDMPDSCDKRYGNIGCQVFVGGIQNQI